ncbi:hypothetical protein SDRG_08379 [Saprolegnia diclina VS20]|uniref:Calx-beta domain-containing protein n=1 Tax=Saprolegnia diclina (strain VS20) TaxID=1156394 RepID=T0QHF1_SAPDV|nr:hypothetical protein SDRG_08379 [Saprolegnia diclina VS20]EQC34171.1 hypothetical protein SDRG_08379 [Saprolegnia diclina VS20]|eukprot:XP_008612483.1 hypothetical protein SDRG_08379 [Saprolegnia diclina VS20]
MRVLRLVLLPLVVHSRLPLPHFRLQDIATHHAMRLVSGCSAHGPEARVLALTLHGDLRWSIEIPSVLAHSHDACATRLAVAGEAIYTTGYHANATHTALFVAKLSINGAITWVKRFGDEGQHHGLGVAVTLDGSIVSVVGTSRGVISRRRTRGDDMVALQLRASDGSTLWSQLVDSDNHGDDQAFSVGVDGSGHIYLVGQTNGRFEHDSGAGSDALHDGDLVVLSFDANGRRRWTRQLHTAEADGCSDDVIYDPQHPRRCGLAMTASNVFVVGATAGTAFLDPTVDDPTLGISSRRLNTVLVQLHLATGVVGWTNQLLLDEHNVGQGIVEMDADTLAVVGTWRERDDELPRVLIAEFATATGAHRRVVTDTTARGIGVSAEVGTLGTLLLGANTLDDAAYLDQRATRDVTMTLPFCTNYVSFASAVTHVASTNWTDVNPIELAIHRHNAPLCTESVTVRYTISSADVGRPFTPASPHKAFVPITGDVRLDAANPTVAVQLAAAAPLDLPPLSALTVTLHAKDDSTEIRDPATHVIVLLGTPAAAPTTQHIQSEVLCALVCALCVFGGLVRRVCHCNMNLWSGVQYRHVEEAPGEHQLPLKHHLQLLRGDAAAVGGHVGVVDGSGAVRPAMVASPRHAKPKCKHARRSVLLPRASADALRDADD